MSTNTGGQAFPGPHWSEGETGMTLLDWMAGQALALMSGQGSGCAKLKAMGAYAIAEAMLAEKARREADHFPDATKMVQDHSPDAGEMAALEAANRELAEVLEASVAVMSARTILAKHKGAA